jgi:hypothetical protein
MVVAAPLATERRCEKALCYTVTVLRQVTCRARRNDRRWRDFLREKNALFFAPSVFSTGVDICIGSKNALEPAA